VVTVVGEPIECPLIEDPSEEQIREYHEKYLEGLKKVRWLSVCFSFETEA
jgi:2-acylglycerol O-acyltransferase 2